MIACVAAFSSCYGALMQIERSIPRIRALRLMGEPMTEEQAYDISLNLFRSGIFKIVVVHARKVEISAEYLPFTSSVMMQEQIKPITLSSEDLDDLPSKLSMQEAASSTSVNQNVLSVGNEEDAELLNHQLKDIKDYFSLLKNSKLRSQLVNRVLKFLDITRRVGNALSSLLHSCYPFTQRCIDLSLQNIQNANIILDSLLKTLDSWEKFLENTCQMAPYVSFFTRLQFVEALTAISMLRSDYDFSLARLVRVLQIVDPSIQNRTVIEVLDSLDFRDNVKSRSSEENKSPIDASSVWERLQFLFTPLVMLLRACVRDSIFESRRISMKSPASMHAWVSELTKLIAATKEKLIPFTLLKFNAPHGSHVQIALSMYYAHQSRLPLPFEIHLVKYIDPNSPDAIAEDKAAEMELRTFILRWQISVRSGEGLSNSSSSLMFVIANAQDLSDRLQLLLINLVHQARQVLDQHNLLMSSSITADKVAPLIIMSGLTKSGGAPSRIDDAFHTDRSELTRLSERNLQLLSSIAKCLFEDNGTKFVSVVTSKLPCSGKTFFIYEQIYSKAVGSYCKIPVHGYGGTSSILDYLIACESYHHQFPLESLALHFNVGHDLDSDLFNDFLFQYLFVGVSTYREHVFVRKPRDHVYVELPSEGPEKLSVMKNLIPLCHCLFQAQPFEKLSEFKYELHSIPRFAPQLFRVHQVLDSSLVNVGRELFVFHACSTVSSDLVYRARCYPPSEESFKAMQAMFDYKDLSATVDNVLNSFWSSSNATDASAVALDGAMIGYYYCCQQPIICLICIVYACYNYLF